MRRTLGTLVVLMVLVAVAAPPTSAAESKRRDRADNSFEFTYDSNAGITSASSSLGPITRDDPVQFTVAVRDRNANLTGIVKLRLIRNEAIRYAGQLDFEVANDANVIAYSGTKSIAVTLRSQKHKRVFRTTFPFTVLSGHYTVTARFSN